jgi:hypothetical protein
MKQHTLKRWALALLTISTFPTLAQVDNVGIGTKTPDKSAILDISSDNKGLLIPRLTKSMRDDIKSPTEGLLIFQLDGSKGFHFFNGKEWTPISSQEAKSIAADPNDWTMAGNSAPSTAFIGTTNNVDLIFRVNNINSGRISNNLKSVYLGTLSGNANGNPTGVENVGIGRSALANITTGNRNIALGQSALLNNTSGLNNFGLGYQALVNNVAGRNNVAIGTFALKGLNSTISTESGNNVGIGYAALQSLSTEINNTAIGHQAGYFNTGSNNTFIGFEAGLNEVGSNKLYIANTRTSNPLIKGDFSDKNLRINVGASNGTANSATTLGYMAIGNFDAASPMAIPSGYRLVVESGILTEKIKVALKSSTVGADWADYVFEPDYQLMPLEEVESFTKENKHLPNVPSADEMVASGLDVAQTSKMFMEKIEELTLYMIELNKEIKNLKAENEAMKATLKK